MTSPSTAHPSISPATPTLRPGQELAFQALGMTDVDWTLEHSPLDGGLLLAATSGLHTCIRVPAVVQEGGIYFLRATSRRDPRQTAVTTLRVAPAGEAATDYRRHQGGRRPLKPTRTASGPARARGIFSGMRGLLGLAPAMA